MNKQGLSEISCEKIWKTYNLHKTMKCTLESYSRLSLPLYGTYFKFSTQQIQYYKFPLYFCLCVRFFHLRKSIFRFCCVLIVIFSTSHWFKKLKHQKAIIHPIFATEYENSLCLKIQLLCGLLNMKGGQIGKHIW